MPTTSPTQSLAEMLLGEPILNWLTDRRNSGASFRTIATQLRKATGDKVDVTAETIRTWIADMDAAA